MEVAFILGSPVTARVADVAALKPLVFAIAPALEIPDLAFADPAGVSGPDLIAANVASARYVLGQERFPSDVVLAEVNPVLRRGGEEILRGRFSDADGDPWNSLLWLVNKALAEGYDPDAGDVFLSGALGGMAPAEPGRHEADFGPLGRISLLIR
jgi:2-keto-4-pentenoate hydratase